MPHDLIDRAFLSFASRACVSWAAAIGSLLIVAGVIGLAVGAALGVGALVFQKRRRSSTSPLVGHKDTTPGRPTRKVKYYDR
jgi:hypothetical protein